MPFLSKDWRSPGEKWVRFQGGWEMKKTVGATHYFRKHGGGSSGEDSGCEAGSDQEVGSWGSNQDVLVMALEVDMDEKERQQMEMMSQCNTLPCKKKSVPMTGSSASSLPCGTGGPTLLHRVKNDLPQPFCPITVKSTKEVAGFNGIAEVLLRLDFINAVRDIRFANESCFVRFLCFHKAEMPSFF